MFFCYDGLIRLYTWAIRLASFKNLKARAWLLGQQNLLEKIESAVDPRVRYTWFHFASLGEFEQGRSVMERLKATQKEVHIFITFFSPSGYEIRKNDPLADHVFYLPIDTARNAQSFIRLINPLMAVFTKYEYWYHYFHELKKRAIPLYLISGIFRKDQIFFKFYGGLHRSMLRCVSHFFVQNFASKLLLESIGIDRVTISGDTRFDRVFENAKQARSFDLIEAFCAKHRVFIAGSTWPDDEKLLAPLMQQYPDWKWIIAPHEISAARIIFLEQLFDKKSVRYSQLPAEQEALPRYSVLIIDNIGMLSSLYQYGQIAYIGGGFGAGIHNTLEAAAFALPVLFGPRYHKFQEASDMIALGAAFSVNNLMALQEEFHQLQNEAYLLACASIAKNYVINHVGATAQIIEHIV